MRGCRGSSDGLNPVRIAQWPRCLERYGNSYRPPFQRRAVPPLQLGPELRAWLDWRPMLQTVLEYPRKHVTACWHAAHRKTARIVRHRHPCAEDRSTYRLGDSESGRTSPPTAEPRSCDRHLQKGASNKLGWDGWYRSREHATRSRQRCLVSDSGIPTRTDGQQRSRLKPPEVVGHPVWRR